MWIWKDKSVPQLEVYCDSPGDVRMRARTGEVAGNREDGDPYGRFRKQNQHCLDMRIKEMEVLRMIPGF